MKTSMLVLTLSATLYAAPAPASAQSDGADELPCNALCRQWMGKPQQRDPTPREAMPAAPSNLEDSGVAVAKPTLAPTTTVTTVKQTRSAKASVAPGRLVSQRAPVTVLPPPRPRSLAATATPSILSTAAPAPIRSTPQPALVTETPTPRPVDAAASAQVMAMLAPPALPAEPVLVAPPHGPTPQALAPASSSAVGPQSVALVLATPAPVSSALPMVAAQIAPPAPPAPPASAKTSPLIMPPAFDVIAALLLAGPTQN